MKLLLTLTLGIASCGIGWGQEKPLPECTSKLVDGVWVIADIPAKGCMIHSECEGDGCHHKPVSSTGLVKVAPLVAHESEALDVPAITERTNWTGGVSDESKRDIERICTGSRMNSDAECRQKNNRWEYRIVYGTCDDKTRILMHDEQQPPERWCHKPQTGDHQ